MSRRGGRRQFFTGRNGTSRVSSDPSGFAALTDLRTAQASLKASVDKWNNFAGSGYSLSGWQGSFVGVAGNTKVTVQWSDSFGIPHQTQVRHDQLMRGGETAILRAANGARQAAIQAAARAGQPAPKLGRAYKKTDFNGATYYISVGSSNVYV